MSGPVRADEFGCKPLPDVSVCQVESPAAAFPSSSVNQADGEKYLAAGNNYGLVVVERTPEPLCVRIKTEERRNRIVIDLAFTRDMVAPKDYGRLMGPDELPFVIEQSMPLTGVWADARNLKVNVDLSPGEYWNRVCGWPAASFNWKKGQSDLNGRPLKEWDFELKPEFIRDCPLEFFQILLWAQAGPVRGDQVSFDLMFSEPVDLRELRRIIKPQILRPEYDAPRPAQLLHITAPEEPGQEVSAYPRLSLSPVAPGDQVILDMTGLVSAGKKRRLQNCVKETVVKNHFSGRREIRAVNGVEESYPWRPYLEIDLQAPIFSERLEKYIRLGSGLNFSAAVTGPEGHKLRLFIDQAAAGGWASITLLPGLTTINGRLTEAMAVPDRLTKIPGSGQVKFLNRPIYLSPSQPSFLAVGGPCQNEDLRLKIWQVYDRNIPAALSLGRDEGIAPLSWLLELSEPRPDRLISRSPLTRTKNCRPRELVDISGERPGIYILSLAGNDAPAGAMLPRGLDDQSSAPPGSRGERRPGLNSADEYRWDPDKTMTVSISDLGLAARIDPRGTAVWVVSLTDSRPVSQAQVELFDLEGQILAAGRTGSDGLFQAGPEAREALFVLAKKGDELNYLYLNLPPDDETSMPAKNEGPELDFYPLHSADYGGSRVLSGNRSGDWCRAVNASVKPEKSPRNLPVELRGEMPLADFESSKAVGGLAKSSNETGWMWNTASDSASAEKKDALDIGLLVPAQPVAGRLLGFQAAARFKSEPAAGKKLKVAVFYEPGLFYANMPVSSDHHGRTWAEAATFSLISDRFGLAAAEFTPPVAGKYKVIIEEPNGGRHQRFFDVFGSISPDEEVVERIDLYFDRLRYRPGEKARLIVRPPFPGPVWLTVESGAQTRHLILKDGDWLKPVIIPVTREMGPNAWVVAMNVAPADGGRLGRRALGAAPLEIDPDLLEFKGKVKSSEAVDFLNGRRKLQSRHFDMYDPRRTRGK